jgi:hypothetical protein
MNKNKIGLTLGLFIALLHAVWAVAVLAGIKASMLEWLFAMHFVSITFELLQFSIANALILVACTFVGGYIMGWIFAAIWNGVDKCKCFKKK